MSADRLGMPRPYYDSPKHAYWRQAMGRATGEGINCNLYSAESVLSNYPLLLIHPYSEESMPYSAEISRVNPTCFVFLIDQSASMADPWGGDDQRTKADGLAVIINRTLQNLVIECSKGDEVRNYFDIAVIGYGARVGPAFTGDLAGQEIARISDVAEHPARVEERTRKMDDGLGGVIEQTVKFPVWFDPITENGTPMCEALRQAETLTRGWVDSHPDAFPPVVINITDGEATDGDPTLPAETLRGIATADGNILLLNVHVSSHKGQDAFYFPESESALPDQYARQLFAMSSALPASMQARARELGYPAGEMSRGFFYQADPVGVIEFLQIGTRPSNLR